MTRSAFLLTLSLLGCAHLLTGCGGDGSAPDLGAPAANDLGALPVQARPDLSASAPDAYDLSVAPGDLAQPPYVPIDGGPGVDIVELVSPGVCQVKNNRLVDCAVGTVHLNPGAPTDPGPWMTVLASKWSQDCSFRYPLALDLVADTDPVVYFDVFNPSRMSTLRRVNRDAIQSLTITNASAWEPYGAYPIGCRLWVEVSMNVHDPVP